MANIINSTISSATFPWGKNAKLVDSGTNSINLSLTSGYPASGTTRTQIYTFNNTTHPYLLNKSIGATRTKIPIIQFDYIVDYKYSNSLVESDYSYILKKSIGTCYAILSRSYGYRNNITPSGITTNINNDDLKSANYITQWMGCAILKDVANNTYLMATGALADILGITCNMSASTPATNAQDITQTVYSSSSLYIKNHSTRFPASLNSLIDKTNTTISGTYKVYEIDIESNLFNYLDLYNFKLTKQIYDTLTT